MSAKLTAPGIATGPSSGAVARFEAAGLATTGGADSAVVGESEPETTIPTSKPTVAVNAAVSHANPRVMTRSL